MGELTAANVLILNQLVSCSCSWYFSLLTLAPLLGSYLVVANMDSANEKKVEEAAEKIWSSSKGVAVYVWDVIVVISVLPSIFLVTFQAFYSSDILWQSPIVYITDAVYLTNIVATFFRSFTRRGVKITSEKDIVINYISSSFFLDLASVLPLELFSFVAENVAYASSLLRLNRCIRCYKPWTFLCKKSVVKLAN